MSIQGREAREADEHLRQLDALVEALQRADSTPQGRDALATPQRSGSHGGVRGPVE